MCDELSRSVKILLFIHLFELAISINGLSATRRIYLCLCILLVHLKLLPPHLRLYVALTLLLLPLLLYYLLEKEELLSIVGQFILRDNILALGLICEFVVRIFSFIIWFTVQFRIHCIMTLYFILTFINWFSIKLINNVIWTATMAKCTTSIAYSISDNVGHI